ncbi:hypothetical protein AAVH_10358 [Aphelenchoides avenae]|nr:hypothetical protein AAVH_10358 [Aphelenchus avenae]
MSPIRLSEFLRLSIVLCTISCIYAVPFYEKELDRVCTAEGEQWACYKGSKLDKDGKIDHLFKVDVFAQSCAAVGCSEDEILSDFCCLTEECLFKCYSKSTPEAAVRRKHKLREAALGRIRMWQKYYPNSAPPAAMVDGLIE